VLSAAAANLVRRAVAGESAYPGLHALIDAFYRAVVSGGEPPISPEECLAVAAAVDDICMAANLRDVTDSRT
jgi:hypothetical protein